MVLLARQVLRVTLVLLELLEHQEFKDQLEQLDWLVYPELRVQQVERDSMDHKVHPEPLDLPDLLEFKG